jgi:hypothetical protein
MVDQDSTHDLGGNAEEVRLVLPIHLALIGEPEVCLVDEGRGLQGMPGPLVFQLPRGDSTQLGIDQRQQSLESIAIAPAPAIEQRRNVRRVHERFAPAETG